MHEHTFVQVWTSLKPQAMWNNSRMPLIPFMDPEVKKSHMKPEVRTSC